MSKIIDRNARQSKTERLGAIVGSAIRHNDREAMMYLLGRLDQEIGDAKKTYMYEAEKQLREALCSALDRYPDPFPDEPEPEPVPIQAVIGEPRPAGGES